MFYYVKRWGGRKFKGFPPRKLYTCCHGVTWNGSNWLGSVLLHYWYYTRSSSNVYSWLHAYILMKYVSLAHCSSTFLAKFLNIAKRKVSGATPLCLDWRCFTGKLKRLTKLNPPDNTEIYVLVEISKLL